MAVTNAKWSNAALSALTVDYDDGRRETAGLRVPGDIATIGNGPTRDAVRDWIALGNAPGPADPPAPPPTNDEIYDRVIQSSRVFKGYVLALNDGSIVPGSNMTAAQLKAAVKAKM